MERSDRKRTTLTPGMVDLPKKRRTSAEVALEKKKKNDVAAARARAKQLAAVQVAELESRMVAQDKGSSVNTLTPKQPHKRPATGASRDILAAQPTVTLVGTLPNGREKKRKADAQPTAMVTKRKGGPRSSAPTKPKGFKNHLTHVSPAPGPPSKEPEATTDGEDSPEGDSEGDGEDESEYPGSDDSASLVIITSSPTNSQTSDHPNRRVARLGVHSLPEAIQRSFADTFVPCVVSKVGCSSEPWHRVRVKDLQSLFALVYPNHDLTITRGDALESATNSRVMSFRNTVARRALENVQAYMKRFNIHETQAYVASAFSYHGEVPFLYRTFRLTENVEPDLKKEAGGFKVIRHGLFQHQIILQTMLMYYQQIKSDVDTACLTGIHPIGVLALTCAAVARALRMHQTGVFVLNATPFSEKDLGKDTRIYLKLIDKLSESRWTGIYSALKVTAEIIDELRMVSKASPGALQDEPGGFHIQDSDPIDPDEDVDVDVE